MRAKFKKNYNNMETYLILGILIIFIVVVVTDWYKNGKEWTQMIPLLILIFPALMIFRPYYISDTHNLTGNGIVPIPMISFIEKGNKRIRILYRKMEGGRIYTRSFYPKDKEAFIKELLQINPNIVVQ